MGVMRGIVRAGLRGQAPECWRDGKLVLLGQVEKPGRWRPIALLELMRRLTGKVALRDERAKAVMADLECSGQLGVGPCAEPRSAWRTPPRVPASVCSPSRHTTYGSRNGARHRAHDGIPLHPC